MTSFKTEIQDLAFDESQKMVEFTPVCYIFCSILVKKSENVKEILV